MRKEKPTARIIEEKRQTFFRTALFSLYDLRKLILLILKTTGGEKVRGLYLVCLLPSNIPD